MLKNTLKFFKTQKPAPVKQADKRLPGEELIYVAKDGSKYYGRKNPLSLDGTRGVLLLGKLREIDQCQTFEEFLAGLNQLADRMHQLGPNQKSYLETQQALLTYIARQHEITSRVMTSDLELTACNLIYRHEDEPREYSAEWTKKKFELWNADPDIKYFFLAAFLRSYKNLSKESPESVKAYLQARELKQMKK